MRALKAVFYSMAYIAVIVISAHLLLGCAAYAKKHPPPKHLIILTWNDSANTEPMCLVQSCTSACRTGYTITQNGKVIANPAFGQTAYSLPAPVPGTYTYAITVNGLCTQTPSSPPKATTVTVP